jgi:hypothetical protein
MLRLETTARFRFAVGITGLLAASLIAGCCGSFGADSEGGCGACEQPCSSPLVRDSGTLDAADSAVD